MAEVTKIQWTTHTFNPWIGCDKVHTGCKFCYAEADMDKRRGRAKWGPNGTRSRTSGAYWKQPLKWNREAEAAGERRRVFCASLADVFEDWQGPIIDSNDTELCICDECRTLMYYIQRECGKECCSDRLPRKLTMNDLRRDLFTLIDRTPHLDWLLLTKRPENIRSMWNAVDPRPAGNLQRRRENVWILTSVSDQATADAMIPPLLACRDLAPVLGVSAEPLLGPIDFRQQWVRSFDGSNYQDVFDDRATLLECGLDWVIVGGESGHNARPCDLAWVHSLVRQCQGAGVACYVKQLGSHPVVTTAPLDFLRFNDKKSGDPTEWPEWARVREFPAVQARRAILCQHCHDRRVNRPRGLCWVCYYTPGVRQRYPSSSKFARADHEPTEAELDAMIAEQMRCLPDWWHQERGK